MAVYDDLAAARAELSRLNTELGGQVVYEPGIAQQLAGNYDSLIADLQRRLRVILRNAALGGYGGFASTLELQSGFQQQASEAADVCRSFIELAYRMQATYLRAGNLTDKAEEKNKLAVAAVQIPGHA